MADSKDNTTPTVRGNQVDALLLEEFAEFCHEHYKGCWREHGEELYTYGYDNEIINYIEDFLGRRAEVTDLPTEYPSVDPTVTPRRPKPSQQSETSS